MGAEVRRGSYQTELADVTTNLIFTSPPVQHRLEKPRGKTASGATANTIRNPSAQYVTMPDTEPEPDYQDQRAAFLIWSADQLTTDGVVVYNHKPRRRNGTIIHPAEWFLRPEVRDCLVLVEEVIWDRGSTHNHAPALMWPQTERLYVFRRTDGDYTFRNTDALPQRADVWRIPLNSHTNGHACPFSIKLAEAVILAWSRPGDLVCDPYLGSGTTALAAIGLGRRFIGAERLKRGARQAELALERVA